MKSLYVYISAIALLLTITSCAQKAKNIVQNKPAIDLSKYSQATFAAGCFWHEEALFESIKGVKEAVSGYAGGKTSNPTYESIESGTTGHAETVNVYYDSTVITFPMLLKVFFEVQDPTQVNGQGPDRGTQYRSIAFYRNKVEKSMIDKYVAQLTASHKYSKPIAAEILPFAKFWEAEAYHQDYIMHNPDGGYVQNVSIPEIREFQKKYPGMIKPGQLF